MKVDPGMMIDRGDYDEVTLYRMNKSTYELIHRVNETGRPLAVTRHGKVLVVIHPREEFS